MFENLVESGSHSEDTKRRGSFILVTLGVYGVLIVAGAVIGILMAPAYIDMQNLELTALIAPVVSLDVRRKKASSCTKAPMPPARYQLACAAKASISIGTGGAVAGRSSTICFVCGSYRR